MPPSFSWSLGENPCFQNLSTKEIARYAGNSFHLTTTHEAY